MDRGIVDERFELALEVEASELDIRSRRRTIGGRSLSALGLLVLGCAESLRLAPTGLPPTQGAESFLVDYPPPPAEVEEVGPDPGGSCVWVDGHWDWTGRRWRWREGGWFTPPSGCYHSTPMLVFLPGVSASALYFWPPRWYPLPERKGQACDAPRPCSGGKAPPPRAPSPSVQSAPQP